MGWNNDDLWQEYVLPTSLKRPSAASCVENASRYRLNFLRLGDAWVVRNGESSLVGRYANCHPRPPAPVRGHDSFYYQRPGGRDSEFDGLLSELDSRVLLATGFRYEPRVAAYFGNGGDRVINPMSALVILDGDTQAYHDLKRDAHRKLSDRTHPTNDRIGPKNADDRQTERRKLNEVCNCVSYDTGGAISESQLLEPYGRASAHGAAATVAAVNTDWLARSGVLTPFMDSDICADIFTGPASRFT